MKSVTSEESSREALRPAPWGDHGVMDNRAESDKRLEDRGR